MLSRLLVAAVWFLHWLPLPVLACLGNALGSVIFGLADGADTSCW
jgi:KDO2-lipid IV(A) lauroyltransferase